MCVCVCVCVCVRNLPFKHFLYDYHIYPTPPLGQDMTQGQFFLKRSSTGFNSEFSFS